MDFWSGREKPEHAGQLELEKKGKKVKYSFAEYQSIDFLILQNFLFYFFKIS